jgi:MFS family permease
VRLAIGSAGHSEGPQQAEPGPAETVKSGTSGASKAIGKVSPSTEGAAGAEDTVGTVRAPTTSRRRARRPEDATTAARVFAFLTLLPPVLLIAWLLPGLPLLLAGHFTGWLMLALWVPIAALLTIGILASAPARWPLPRAPWWPVAAVIVIAAGFGVWQALVHSQQVIVRRDPATYVQFAYWIARHGSLPIPQLRSAFGGAVPGMSFESLGFYAHGTAVVPQFMAGLPMTLAAAFWINGTQLAVLFAPVFGACAVLTFGGLVGRLCGLRWAPLGALVLALSLPEIYTSRSAFSEPLAQILIFGGLCFVTDALWLDGLRRDPARQAQASRTARGERPDKTPPDAAAQPGEKPPDAAALPGGTPPDAALPGGKPPDTVRPGETPLTAGRRRETIAAHVRTDASRRPSRGVWLMAALGGLSLGLSVLVRIDGASDILPVILFCGVLFATRRRPAALALAGGLAVGAGYGLADGYLLSRPYLNSLSSLMRPLGYAAAAFAAVTLALALISLWRQPRGLRRGNWEWVADLAAIAAVAVMAAFAVRPLVQIVRGETSPVTIAFIKEVQKLAHLPIDPTRTYAEDSLYWVIWYIGVPAVLLATFGAALLIRRFLRGSALLWGLPVMIISWSVVVTLWRPGIVPDQPWASRRLVPVVLPGLVLLAVWACSWLVQRAAQRGAGPGARGAIAGCCAVALLLPTAATSFGLAVERANDGGLKLVASGLAFKRTDTREIVAVTNLCRAIGPHAAVVIVDPLTADRFTQIVRGMCDTPAARVDSPTPALITQVTQGIERAGRRPVLLASESAQLTPYGGTVHRVVYVATRQDEHRLTQPPTTTWRIVYEVWMSSPGTVP